MKKYDVFNKLNIYSHSSHHPSPVLWFCFCAWKVVQFQVLQRGMTARSQPWPSKKTGDQTRSSVCSSMSQLHSSQIQSSLYAQAQWAWACLITVLLRNMISTLVSELLVCFLQKIQWWFLYMKPTHLNSPRLLFSLSPWGSQAYIRAWNHFGSSLESR